VDAVTDDAGQALVPVVLALAIAAVTIVGLRAVQDRFAEAARAQRAGEAAVEAAAQSIADVYATRPAEARAIVLDPRVIEDARVAAEALARENGAGGVGEVRLLCSGTRIEAHLDLGGHSHRAGFTAAECSPR
jgi:hypothetical protein